MLFPLIPVPPFIFTLYFSSISWKRMTGAVKSRAVKVVDKEREGSKSVIVKGKEFSKEKRKTRGKMQVAKTFFFFFYILQWCCIRSQRTGERTERKKEVKCLVFPHPSSLALGVSQSIFLCICDLAISCSLPDHVNSSSVLFMNEKARRHGNNISRKTGSSCKKRHLWRGIDRMCACECLK